MKIEGLTDFQEDLLRTAYETPKATASIMRKVGNKAKKKVSKRARRDVKKDTGNYHKKWKRGKVFEGENGEMVVRVINSSPHAHLIEDGHVIKNEKGGPSLGFVPGKKVLERGMQEFESSGEFSTTAAKELDNLLRKNKL